MPSSLYVCDPETLKLPAPPVITPVSVAEPSPQSIVAVYSFGVAAVSGSVKVATVPLKLAPSVALKVVPLAVIGASGGGPPTWANWNGPGACVVSY